MTYIGEEFQKRYKTLPEDIQNALTAVASVDTIFAMGKKHGLMVDQIGKMADEIWKVMLGLANPKDFIRNLASLVGIDSAKASAIASEVNAQIFQPIQESLRRLYDQIPLATPKEEAQPPSSLRATEGSEAISQSKDRIASSAPPPRNDGISPMIYPQDRFEEEFKKEEIVEDKEKEEKKAAPDLPAKQAGQLAPLVPAIVPPDVGTLADPQAFAGKPATPPDDFTYPGKTKDVSREPAIGSYKGRPVSYAGRDPYRESTEE